MKRTYQDEGFCLLRLKEGHFPDVIQKIPDEFLRDKDFVCRAIEDQPNILRYTPFNSDKEMVIRAIYHDYSVLSGASEALRDDEEVVSLAIQRTNLKSLHEKYPDKKMTDEWGTSFMDSIGWNVACATATNFIKNVSPRLRSDKEFILKAVKTSGFFLLHIDPVFQKDKDVVFEAVKSDFCAFAWADESLKKDRDFVLACCKVNPGILQYVDGSLLEDREIAITAIETNGRALMFIGESFRDDKEIVLKAIANSHILDWVIINVPLAYASERLRNDPDVVKAAMEKDFKTFVSAGDEIQDNKEFALCAVQQDGLLLKYCSDRLRADNEVVIAAIKQNREALQHVSENLWLNLLGIE